VCRAVVRVCAGVNGRSLDTCQTPASVAPATVDAVRVRDHTDTSPPHDRRRESVNRPGVPGGRMKLNRSGPVSAAAASPSGAGESKPADVRIIRFREVHQLCGLSRSTLWRKMRDREFPRSVKLLKHSGKKGPIGWYAHEVQAFLRGRDRS